jgi:fermentation-respiration switch protein FrsA (DUF1100 family)
MVAGGPFASDSVHCAPTGVLADLLQFLAIGRPTWDPRCVRCPSLITVGEWDTDTPPYMALELFEQLSATPYKRLEVLARGTHSMALELNQLDLFQRVRNFLLTEFA